MQVGDKIVRNYVLGVVINWLLLCSDWFINYL